MARTPASADRLVIWPIALACSFPIALVALWAGPFSLTFVGVPALLMIWISTAVLALGLSVRSALVLRSWRRAFSWSLLALVTLVAAVNSDWTWSLAIEAGQRIHFQMVRASYLDDVSQLPSNEPRFVVWRWGGFVVGHGVVYDESDEIALPERSAAWNKRVAGTEVGMCGAWGVPLGDHFYLVRMGC